MKNIFKALLFIIACLTLFSSCKKTTIDTDDFDTGGYILVDSYKKHPDWVLKIGGADVTFAEYRHYYLNTKNELDGGTADFWKDHPEYESVLKNKVEAILIEMYSVRKLCRDAGISSDIDEIYASISQYKKDMTSSEFDRGLEKFYLTEALYAYKLEGYQLYDFLYEYYFGENGKRAMNDKEIVDYAKEYYTHTEHILVYPNTSMSEDDYEKHLNTILERVNNGEDFGALIAEYSNDADTPDYGCYFIDKEMNESYVAAAKELEIGETSDLVKTPDGYYIIKRLPVNENDTQVLRDIIYNRKYADMIESTIESISVEYCPEYDYIAPDTFN